MLDLLGVIEFILVLVGFLIVFWVVFFKAKELTDREREILGIKGWLSLLFFFVLFNHYLEYIFSIGNNIVSIVFSLLLFYLLFNWSISMLKIAMWNKKEEEQC